MKQLLQTMPQIGVVQWIGVRPGRREPIQVLDSVEANDQAVSYTHLTLPTILLV